MLFNKRPNFGDNLKRIREKQSLTQGELADKIKVTKAAISQFETGKMSRGLVTLIKLADALQVTLDELVFGIRDENLALVSKSINIPDKGRRLIELYKEIAMLEGELSTEKQKK